MCLYVQIKFLKVPTLLEGKNSLGYCRPLPFWLSLSMVSSGLLCIECGTVVR